MRPLIIIKYDRMSNKAKAGNEWLLAFIFFMSKGLCSQPVKQCNYEIRESYNKLRDLSSRRVNMTINTKFFWEHNQFYIHVLRCFYCSNCFLIANQFFKSTRELTFQPCYMLPVSSLSVSYWEDLYWMLLAIY